MYRDELGYHFDQAAQGWRALQPPTVSRGPVPFDVAAQLGVAPGDEAVIRDRLMGDPETGRPAQLATSYIPAPLAAELPVLAARDNGPGGIYDRMEADGLGPIEWTEAITTRPPSPAEASLLRLAPGTALLRIVRLASSPAGRPAAGSQRHAHERRRVRDLLPVRPGLLGTAQDLTSATRPGRQHHRTAHP